MDKVEKWVCLKVLEKNEKKTKPKPKSHGLSTRVMESYQDTIHIKKNMLAMIPN